MIKMKNMKKWIVGVVLLLTTVVGVGQNDCVSRTHRYSEAPSITTIYPCNSLVYERKHDIHSYNVAILCDSIYRTTKTYKIYAEIKGAMGYPQFELYLVNGDTLRINPDYVTPHHSAVSYMEATLEEDVLEKIRKGRVRDIAIWHQETWGPGEPFAIKCGTFFQDFVTKH